MKQKFIGRENEIAIFKEILNNNTPEKPYILYIHDATTERSEKGGVGKTWLLNRFIEIAKKEYSDRYLIVDKLIDFYEIQNHNRVSILVNVVQQLEDLTTKKYFNPFHDALKQFNAAIDAHADEVRMRLAYEDLFAAYATCYRNVAEGEQKKIIRFYDTLDAIEAFERVLITAQKEFPMSELAPYSQAVIASRNEINWDNPNWQGRQKSIRILPLKVFVQSESKKYFHAYCNMEVEDAKIDTIHEKAKGRPILVGLAVDLINHRVKNIDNLIAVSGEAFLETLVSYINLFEKPRDVVITFMAHVFQHFDKKILHYLLEKDFPNYNYDSLARELPTLSFVKSSGNQFILQDEMRRLVNLFVWQPQDPDRELRKKISAKMIDYYEQKLKAETDDNFRQILIAEQLYHKIYAEMEKGWQEFEKLFMKNLDEYRLGYARLLLKSIEDFKKFLPIAKKAMLTVYEGWFEIYNCNYRTARNLIELGKIELEKWNVLDKMDEILNSLGFIHRLTGDWKNAIATYKEALELSRGFKHPKITAMILNNLGNVYRFLADSSHALMYSEESLSIREELKDKPAIGRTCLILGKSLWEARNINEAIRYFNKAYLIFEELDDQIELARVKTNLGYVEYRLEKFDSALDYLNSASAVFKARGILVEYAETLLIIGRIKRDSGDLKEAEKIVKKALSILEKGFNKYALCDAQLNLLILYYKKRDFSKAEDYYKQGVAIAQRYQYNLLWSLLERYAGNLYYDQGNFKKAFEKYAASAKLATYCRESELNTVLSELRTRIKQLSQSDLIVSYCDFISDFWKKEKLDQNYPQVIETCEGIKELKNADPTE